MLKIITTLTVFLVGMLAKGQVTENRNAADFSKVTVNNGIELIYSEAESTSLHIETTNSDLLKNTITEVAGKTLNIYLTEGTTIPANETVKVYVTAKQIAALEAHSNATVTIMNQLHANHLDITLDSGAKMNGNFKVVGKTKLYASTETVFNGRIETAIFKGNFKNNAKINLTGNARNASFQMTDTTLLSAKNFTANTIHLNANDKSVAMIHANTNISLNVADNAKVSYIGYPENIVMNEEAQAYIKSNNNQLVTYNDMRN